MRTAGVREARQNLSTLLDEVKKGREIVITERGRPVAKLVPPDRPRGKGVPISTTIEEDREDRI